MTDLTTEQGFEYEFHKERSEIFIEDCCEECGSHQPVNLTKTDLENMLNIFNSNLTPEIKD